MSRLSDEKFTRCKELVANCLSFDGHKTRREKACDSAYAIGYLFGVIERIHDDEVAENERSTDNAPNQ